MRYLYGSGSRRFRNELTILKMRSLSSLLCQALVTEGFGSRRQWIQVLCSNGSGISVKKGAGQVCNCQSATLCDSLHTVKCYLRGGGHTWPGRWYPLTSLRKLHIEAEAAVSFQSFLMFVDLLDVQGLVAFLCVTWLPHLPTLCRAELANFCLASHSLPCHFHLWA